MLVSYFLLCVWSERSLALLYCIYVAHHCKTQVLSIASKPVHRCATLRGSMMRNRCQFAQWPHHSSVNHTAGAHEAGSSSSRHAVPDTPLGLLAHRTTPSGPAAVNTLCIALALKGCQADQDVSGQITVTAGVKACRIQSRRWGNRFAGHVMPSVLPSIHPNLSP